MTSPGRPTLQTIADAAGVSRSGVSLALRNHPSLPVATRERIQRMAQELGYQPNPMISALMANLKAARQVTDRGMIAFLTSHSTRDGWRQVKVYRDYFEGASSQAARLGYRLEEFWLKEPRMTSARMTTVLKTRNVSGVIVAPFPAGRGHLSLDVSHFAVAALGYSMTRPKLHRVASDYLESMRLTLRKLKQRCRGRIALVMSKVEDRLAHANYTAGFLVYQQGLTAENRVPIFFSDGREVVDFQRWVEENRPEAIICASREDLNLVRRAGIAADGKLFVAMLADLPLDEGIVGGIDEMGTITGAVAVDIIVGQIHRNERGIPQTAKLTLTEGNWLEGTTQSPALVAAPGLSANGKRRLGVEPGFELMTEPA